MEADLAAGHVGIEGLTATEMSRRLAAGETTSEALVAACLGRIAAREDAVGAWTWIDPEAALARARAADREARRGPLHGIPVAIKDIIDTADMPTEYGSAAYAGHRPTADAACVALLREAGMVPLGKTVTTEFAALTPGKTRNPHDPGRSPGGSSSGSAAAVADFMAPLALGTQTVGSTVRPASYCGAVGFKPTYQTFSLAGVKAQAESLDTLGLMARAVDDIVLFGDALLSGFADAVPRLDRPLRVGFARSPHWPHAEPFTVAIMDRAIGILRAAGAEVADCDAADGMANALDAQWTILSFEFARILSFERTQRRESLSEGLVGLLDRGMTIPLADYRAALAVGERCRGAIGPVFDRFDVLVTPAAAGEALLGVRTQSDLLFQRLWTMLRLPAITLPGFAGPNGLPVGVQFVGAPGRDGELLAAARFAEAAFREGLSAESDS
jgi:Asp-tRNA(Asn)/Glu-tRNA(Gln) amidotransferase A subunit family amidase